MKVEFRWGSLALAANLRGSVSVSLPLYFHTESAGQSRRAQAYRGKSGLHRAECQVTPGQRELTASATESRPPNGIFGCAW